MTKANNSKRSPWYINDALLSEILEVQLGVPLDKVDGDTAIRFLRLSPSALLQCSRPIEMIVNHRKDNPVSEMVNKADCLLLIQMLQQTLATDFRRKELQRYFFEARNIRELETITTVKVKGLESVVLENTANERLGVGRLDDSLGGGFVCVSIFPAVPEPWEKGGIGGRKVDEAATIDSAARHTPEK